MVSGVGGNWWMATMALRELIGGDKTGNNRFYDKYIPIADRLYDVYMH